MSNNTIDDFCPGQKVIYVPTHAHGDKNHPDCEVGHVSSVNRKYVFVKFDKQLNQMAWDDVTSQACRPEDLEIIKPAVVLSPYLDKP